MKNKIFLFLLLLVPLTMLAAMTQSQKSSMIKKAETEFRAGNYDEARGLYMEIYIEGGREKKYNDLKILCEKLSELMSDANKAISRGDYALALEQYREVKRLNPSDRQIDSLIASCQNKIDPPKPVDKPSTNDSTNSGGKGKVTVESSVEYSRERTRTVNGREVEHTYEFNGHEAVDLGLSVKWATCNVGAYKPSDYGDYYAWGETKKKYTYTSDNSLTDGKSMNDIGGTQYDVAHTEWGGRWRMPTKAELEELRKKCKWKWTKVDGHKGYKVTGPNGKSIFLPAAGYRVGDSARYVGSSGFYWSSTPYSNDDNACELYFYDGSPSIYHTYRICGQTIRPVSE